MCASNMSNPFMLSGNIFAKNPKVLLVLSGHVFATS